MDYFWTIYLVTRLDAIQSLFATVTGLGIFISLLSALAAMLTTNSPHEVNVHNKARSIFKTAFITAYIGATLSTFIPTKNDAMVIIASTTVIDAVKSETGQRIAGKSVAVVEKWLDEAMKEGEKK